MLSRRDFLKGMLATIATTAIKKNGVLRPAKELETPTRTIFDMAQNTWREQQDAGFANIFMPRMVVNFAAPTWNRVFPHCTVIESQNLLGVVLEVSTGIDGNGARYIVALGMPLAVNSLNYQGENDVAKCPTSPTSPIYPL